MLEAEGAPSVRDFDALRQGRIVVEARPHEWPLIGHRRAGGKVTRRVEAVALEWGVADLGQLYVERRHLAHEQCCKSSHAALQHSVYYSQHRCLHTSRVRLVFVVRALASGL